MSVVKPPIFSGFVDAETRLNGPVSEELVRKMIHNCNLLGDLALIGSIRHIQLNQAGVVTPNPDIWQMCDGGEITNQYSPLSTVVPTNRYTPDMRSRLVKGAPFTFAEGNDGAATVNLNHAHGGNTGTFHGGIDAESGNDVYGYEGAQYNHDHTIDPSLSAAEPLEVAHQRLAVYLKIN